jgi:hypothetical protein
VLLFNWFPKFLKTVNLGHLTEETFEILACYFPVDFKAPTQDPNVRKICAIYHYLKSMFYYSQSQEKHWLPR